MPVPQGGWSENKRALDLAEGCRIRLQLLQGCRRMHITKLANDGGAGAGSTAAAAAAAAPAGSGNTGSYGAVPPAERSSHLPQPRASAQVRFCWSKCTCHAATACGKGAQQDFLLQLAQHRTATALLRGMAVSMTQSKAICTLG